MASYYEEYIETGNLYIKTLREGHFKSKEFAIDRYKEYKKLYEELCNCGANDCSKSKNKKSLKLTATVFCHIANGHKNKALIAFDKWKESSINQLERAFSGDITMLKLANSDGGGVVEFSGENNSSELLRFYGLMEKNDSIIFELMINELS
jgi:hypothetical protein